jgi:hypothetical protein
MCSLLCFQVESAEGTATRETKWTAYFVFYPNVHALSSCQLTDTELLTGTAKQDAVRSVGHVSHVERKLSPGASW